VALRRKQRERLESKHHGKPSHREEGEIEHIRRKAVLGKRRNGGTPVGYSERIALKREPCNEYNRSYTIGERKNGRFQPKDR
jgi:hypothetical protein